MIVLEFAIKMSRGMADFALVINAFVPSVVVAESMYEINGFGIHHSRYSLSFW